jgi:hypothetical protein
MENKQEYRREKGGWRYSIQFGRITFVSFNLFATLFKICTSRIQM